MIFNIIAVISSLSLLDCASGAGPSMTAFSPALPDNLPNPMDVLQIDSSWCARDCYNNDNCMSFAYDVERGECKKYGGNYFGNIQKENNQSVNIPLYNGPMYFFNLSHALDRGYIMDREAELCYKVVTSKVSHDDAEVACSVDKARLLAIQTEAQLDAILNHTMTSSAESLFPLHVAGDGLNMTLFDQQPILDNLYTINGTTASGNCTHLTTTGITNGPCRDALSFICGY